MTRLRSLIKHPPSPSMSARQEVRLLSKQLRKLENKEPTPETINLMLRLSQRIGVLRKQINPPVKGPVGRPKKVTPTEPEVVVEKTPLEIVLEQEKLRRETPEPSIVHEHARRAEVKAEIKKEREVIENPPITASQSDVPKAADGITPLKQPAFTLREMFQVISRPLDGDEVLGSVGLTNALLRDFESAPEPQEPVESGYLAEWNWVPKKW